jgi:DNA-binding helix-hairpin-helix protein with protein kinase domain
MSKNFVTSKGARIDIGRELGVGGEGSVFEIAAPSTQVAKLYNVKHMPDAPKQAKLTFMMATADERLLNYVAWPQETVHPSRGGPVIGFLMPKITGREPIHMIYSPAHRRTEKPTATWQFLVFVARNVAAAFEELHSRGHVVGDVNQGNILVGKDSKAVLIDSDSFQINAAGKRYLCEVAVSHFVPPELQGLSSFNDVARTANHDNFGLALVIFHLLFGGRHPYSGVPLRKDIGDSLEASIKGFQYAYARDAQVRGIGRPPKSIPATLVPEAMEAMFNLAFTEKGVSSRRPTAQEWVTALDGVRAGLKKCTETPMHVFSNHLSKCPWCVLENHGVIYFLDLGTTYARAGSGFVLEKVWALITAVRPPPAVNIPSLDSFSLTPQPLPPSIPGKNTQVTFRILALGIGGWIFLGIPAAWWVGLLVGIVGWNMAGTIGTKRRAAERAKRQSVKNSARQAYDQILPLVNHETTAGFKAKLGELSALREEFLALPQNERRELDKLHSTALDRQKHKFLDTFFIDSAPIPGLGPSRKAALSSAGIETAADVTRAAVLQVKGFGESLTRAVIDWRLSCERQFMFNPAAAVTEADKNIVRAKFGARRTSLERALTGGAAELRQIAQAASARTASLQPKVDERSKQLAQAQLDLTVF